MSARDGRPALEIDEFELLRLRAAGWGYRRLAKHFGVSRSTIRRRHLGMVRGHAPLPNLGPGTTESGRPFVSSLLRRVHRLSSAADVMPGARRRSGADRKTAQTFLRSMAAPDASDAELVLATWMLERVLDEAPERSPVDAATVVAQYLREHVEARTRAEEKDGRELRARSRDASIDLGRRWRADAALLETRLAPFAYGERTRLIELLNGEIERAETLLERRLETLPMGADWKALVDHLVEQGLERAEDAFERVPDEEADR